MVQRDFVQTVVASGRVETAHRVEIGAQITATVRRVAVAEGQAVQAGQLLIELDDAELVAVQRQAGLVGAGPAGRPGRAPAAAPGPAQRRMGQGAGRPGCR